MYNDTEMLEGIFKYQENLMSILVNKGMLKPFPLPMPPSERADQEHIKRVIGWLNEELAEASYSYSELIHAYVNNSKPGFVIKRQLENTFIEIADAMAFMVELLIFSSITAADVLAYYEELLKQRNLELILTGDGLTTGCNYANQTNIFDDPVRVARAMSFSFEYDAAMEVKVKISDELYPLVELDFWNLAKKLLLTGNLLKKRDWSIQERGVELQEYHYNLMECWLYFMKLCNTIGMTDKVIYHYYEKKNLINQERQKTNY